MVFINHFIVLIIKILILYNYVMNRIEKNIQGFKKDARFPHHLKSSTELLKVQLSKISEIEKLNSVEFPKFVKDGLIDCFATDKSKKAFLNADNLRYKPAKWLHDNNIISILYCYANGEPSTYKIENMTDGWLDYEVFKKNRDRKHAEIIDKTFKDGMSIFD